jgi:hypothetical protein
MGWNYIYGKRCVFRNESVSYIMQMDQLRAQYIAIVSYCKRLGRRHRQRLCAVAVVTSCATYEPAYAQHTRVRVDTAYTNTAHQQRQEEEQQWQ